MIRLFRFLPVALLTFALGSSAAALIGPLTSSVLNNVGAVTASRSSCVTSTEDNPDITQPVDGEPLEFCDLARDPERFNGKTVRFHAILAGNKHGMLIFGRHCDVQAGQAAVFFYPPTRSEMLHRLDCARGNENHLNYLEPVEILATGKFFKVTPSFDSDLNGDTAELQIELTQIESALRVP